MHRRGLCLGTADAFTHNKEQHFLVPPASQVPVHECAQAAPMSAGLSKPKRDLTTGFKERRKSKYQR